MPSSKNPVLSVLFALFLHTFGQILNSDGYIYNVSGILGEGVSGIVYNASAKVRTGVSGIRLNSTGNQSNYPVSVKILKSGGDPEPVDFDGQMRLMQVFENYGALWAVRGYEVFNTTGTSVSTASR